MFYESINNIEIVCLTKLTKLLYKIVYTSLTTANNKDFNLKIIAGKFNSSNEEVRKIAYVNISFERYCKNNHQLWFFSQK